MTQEQKLVASLVASMNYGAILADVTPTHRVIQVALDKDNVFILPQFDAGTMEWTCYKQDGAIVYFKRISSGYYQLQQAKYFIEDKLS